jgi:hypothetical protein
VGERPGQRCAPRAGEFSCRHGQRRELYLDGDHGTAATIPGAGVRQNDTVNGRLRRDGALIPYNNFDPPSIHCVDMRVQRRFRLAGRMALDAMIEMFNVFDHANYATALFVLRVRRRDDGAQRGERQLWPAAAEREHRVSAPHGAARRAVRVLIA